MIKIKQLLEKYKNNNSSLKHVSMIAGGSVIAQGFTMLTMPILSRIYSPGDFGILSVFSSVMAIAIPLSSLRYYLAIALPKTKRYADALIVLTFIIQVAFLMLMTLLTLIFGNALLQFFGIQKLIPYKMLLPIAVFGASLYGALVQWAIRDKLFGVIAQTKITQSLSAGIVKIAMGLLGYKPIGLLLGTVVGQAGGITSVFRALHKKNGLPAIDKTGIRRAALKYRKFPMFDTLASTINVTGDQIISILVFSFYGATVAGFFSIAQQLLVIPSVFIGDAIGQVFLQRASVAKYEGGLALLTRKTYKTLFIIGVAPTILIAIFSPYIFSFVLGEQWSEAGLYARCLIPFAALSFAFSPISHVFNITNRQGLALKLEVAYFIAKLFGFLVGVYFKNPLYSVSLFAISGGAMVSIRTYFAMRITHTN